MEKTCLIGIDVGTSGVKVLALATEGQILATAVESYPLHSPRPGWTQQDPADWWAGTIQALKSVLTAIDGFKIAAIGLSGQMHGMVALDSQNQVVREAILWNDQRTENQCQEITAAAGGLDGLLGMTNNQMLTGYTGGKILWLKQNEPDNYARTRVVINPKDYIRYCLTGEIATEVSDASGFGFFDVQNKTWHRDLIERVGLDPSLFPSVVESSTLTGAVTATAAAACGLAAGIPVCGGGGDAVISTTGLGLYKPGRVAVTLGTSGVVAMALPSFMNNPQGSLQLFRGNSPDTFTAMGVTLAAAGSYHWFREALGQHEIEQGQQQGRSAFALLDEAAAATPAGAEGLIFLPYLTGERCPINDPAARGGFIGLTSHHKKGHFARAVLEGVAFSLRQVYDLTVSADPQLESESGDVVLAGGGAASPLWRQIIADVFGLPVRTVYGSAEGGSFGAALVAGVSIGIWPDLAATVPLIRQESETLPDPENRATYDKIYRTYTRLYDALKWSFAD
ncbi:MAG: xylulokinase [Clostridia bacterium]|nr:xylulokinase [Clostridia bacterium]